MEKKNILVVDDEAFLREIIIFDLKRSGYTTVEAENGEQAIKIVQSEKIDLILSDIRMPQATGVQLLTWVRQLHPANPPLVFMTAFSDTSSEEVLDLGATAFLRKPVERGEMLDVVKRGLLPRACRWLENSISHYGLRSIVIGAEAAILPENPSTQLFELGHGGIFLQIDSAFPLVFEVVNFQLVCPGHKLNGLQGLGQVRWVRHVDSDQLSRGIGVEFLKLDQKSYESVNQYLLNSKTTAFIPLGRVK